MVIELTNNWPADTIKRLQYLRKIQEEYLARVNETLGYKEEENITEDNL